MKFIYEIEPKKKQLTFADVAENQFFVCDEGYLCQKVDSEFACTIADPDGDPSCNYITVEDDHPITRILPKIAKIEF